MQTNSELGLTERAATRIIDLLLDKPRRTEESRRSPDSVMSFEPLAIQPTTVAASAASAACAITVLKLSRLRSAESSTERPEELRAFGSAPAARSIFKM